MENIQKTNGHTWRSPFFSSVSWTPQQLYAPLFLASSSSSTNTLSLKTLFQKNLLPPSSYNAVTPLHFFLWCLFFASHSSALLFTGQQAWLAQPLSLLLHAYCNRHQALSFLAARPIWPGFMVREGGSPSQKVPPLVKVLLQLQKARLIPYGH